jgi:hypothetical protein
VDFNARCPLVLACGDDRGAALWAAGSGRSEPLLVLRSPAGGDMLSGPDAPAATPFPAPVTSGCFFYHDKFILLAAGDAVHAFTFALDSAGAAGAEEDVARLKRRYASGSRYSRAVHWRGAGEGSTVQLLAAHNAFRSHLVFAACSDRSVRVFDAGAGGGGVREALRIADAHGRAIHTLALPPAASHALAPVTAAASLDAVLSASTDGAVKLWDLRSGECARVLSGGHLNHQHATGVAVSADACFVAVGSEDRTAVIYDVRAGGVLAKLRGATDTVTSVAFHPGLPHLAAGSLDGGVRFYREAGLRAGDE